MVTGGRRGNRPASLRVAPGIGGRVGRASDAARNAGKLFVAMGQLQDATLLNRAQRGDRRMGRFMRVARLQPRCGRFHTETAAVIGAQV